MKKKLIEEEYHKLGLKDRKKCQHHNILFIEVKAENSTTYYNRETNYYIGRRHQSSCHYFIDWKGGKAYLGNYYHNQANRQNNRRNHITALGKGWK